MGDFSANITLIPIIIFGTGALIAIAASPFIGLLAFTAILFVPPASIIPALGSQHIAKAIVLLTFISMLFHKRTPPLIKKYTQVNLLAVLVIWVLLSIATSIWKSNSLDYAVNFVKIFIGFLLIINVVDSEKKMKVFISLIIACGAYIAAYILLNYIRGNTLYEGFRVGGLEGSAFEDPNDAALILVMIMPFCYACFIGSKFILKKLLFMAVFILLLIGIIYTGSRGGFLGLLAIALFLFLKNKHKFAALTILTSLSIIFFIFAPAKYKERIQSTFTVDQTDDNATIRFDAWKAGISMMAHNFLGVGMGNFGEAFPIYRPENALDTPGMRRSAHNMYVQIGGETGIIGLIIFLLLIRRTMVSLKITSSTKNKTHKLPEEIVIYARATSIALIGFLVCGLFLSQAYSWFLYCLIGLSVVLAELRKKCEA